MPGRQLLALLLGFIVLPISINAAEKPNVILFLVDDMGWADSTPYGSQYYVTPNMQRLTKDGMRFTQAYSQPLCSPTRACLLTGQNAARHRITSAVGHTPPQEAALPKSAPANRAVFLPESQSYLAPEQYTLAEALQDAGYRTGHFGKWHLGLTEPHWPERQGFDIAFHCHPDPGPPNAYFSPYGVLPPGSAAAKQKGQKQVVGTITDGPDGEYITDRLTDEALRFISNNKDRPFFLNLWHYGVHGPWGHKESLTAEMTKLKDPTGRQSNPVMASMLKSIDESLGRILDRLDELGLADNTIVLFTSDNGGNTHSNTEDDQKSQRRPDNPTAASYRKWAGFLPPTNNAPLRDGKGRLYEGGVRVPLIVRWPGKIKPNSTDHSVVGCIDYYPTLLDLIGLQRPERQKFDGTSLAPVLRGTGQLNRDAYFIWFPHLVPGVSVRQGDWKLIRRFEERPSEYLGTRELFNLKDDLGETNNLATKMPEKVRELDALIDAFITQTGAIAPQPNPAFTKIAQAAAPQAKIAADAGNSDLLKGLVAQKCKATLLDSAVQIEATNKGPYLGTAAVKLTGPLTLKLRARSSKGGAGSVKWRTSDEAEFPKNGPSVSFELRPSDDWQDLTLQLPVQGQTAIIQLHLPAEQSPVEIQSIQYSDNAGNHRKWSFSKAKS